VGGKEVGSLGCNHENHGVADREVTPEKYAKEEAIFAIMKWFMGSFLER